MNYIGNPLYLKPRGGRAGFENGTLAEAGVPNGNTTQQTLETIGPLERGEIRLPRLGETENWGDQEDVLGGEQGSYRKQWGREEYSVHMGTAAACIDSVGTNTELRANTTREGILRMIAVKSDKLRVLEVNNVWGMSTGSKIPPVSGKGFRCAFATNVPARADDEWATRLWNNW